MLAVVAKSSIGRSKRIFKIGIEISVAIDVNSRSLPDVAVGSNGFTQKGYTQWNFVNTSEDG